VDRRTVYRLGLAPGSWRCDMTCSEDWGTRLPAPHSRRCPSSSGRVKAASKSHRVATADAGLYSVRAGGTIRGAGQEPVGERSSQLGELCTCGRPARVVFLGGRFVDTGWCGFSDGGSRGLNRPGFSGSRGGRNTLTR
jgi:hypothetical protein